jgi:acetylornithine deacetylase/succinyl-diaminopimelate desuccinylase-like protein
MELAKVRQYLKENHPRFVAELGEYIRFASISAQPDHRPQMEACAQWLRDHCEQIGLTAKLVPTPGNPVVVAKTPVQPGLPTFLVYGHYDVQPVDPLELWQSKPFEPRVAKNVMYGRGTCDNKGQHLAHLNAIEAYLKTGTPLPCNLTFICEGEEEVGSLNLAGFLQKHKAELACDAVVISDTGMPSRKHPALTYALRGVACLEVKLTGPSRDLHSGLFGGSVDNPAMALCQMLAQLRDKKGRITVPGFYEDVAALSAFERKQLARLPYKEAEYKKFLGVKTLFGEAGFTAWEQRTARPTLEINGLTSGYQGVGSKTIVPSWASAKITTRLVANQKPKQVLKAVSDHLKKLCPPTMKIAIEIGHAGDPYLMSPTSELAQAALRALKSSFQCEPVLLREGGSIPIVNDFKKILKADTLLLGLSLPDDNAHSPNEKFDLKIFALGMQMSATLWPELADKSSK